MADNLDESNPSKDGFAAEKTFIENLDEYSGIKQHYYKTGKKNPESKTKSSLIKYKMTGLCTTLRFLVGEVPMTENDGNMILEADSKFLTKFTDSIYDVDLYENVAFQSKFYSKNKKVKTNDIKHDVINILITPKVSYNLMQDSFIVCENIPKKYSNEIDKYGAKIISPEQFKSDVEIILNMGSNTIGFVKYSEKKHLPYSINIGELMLVKHSGNIRLINYIDPCSISKNPLKQKISTIDEKIETVLTGFKAQKTYLNPEYYIYSTKTGQIDNEGREFLDDIKAKEATYEEVLTSFRKGEFFKDFEKIDRNAYAIREIVLGNAKWEMLTRLKVGLRKKGIKIPHPKIHDCIDYFFKD